MISTILWAIYLAALIFLTYDCIVADIARIRKNNTPLDLLQLIIVSCMWSAWYFFYIK